MSKGNSTVKIVGRIACSWWVIVLVMIVAPLFWGLLPLGYAYIKNTSSLIKANPTFIVAMRMGWSCFVTFILFLILYFIGWRKAKKAGNAGMRLGEYFKGILAYFPPKVWGCLFLLAISYFGARFIEMKWILGYTYDNSKQYQSCCDGIRNEHPCYDTTHKWFLDSARDEYLKSLCFADHCLLNPHWMMGEYSYKDKIAHCAKEAERMQKSVAKDSTAAIQEFGYYMGLLLALMCPVLFFVLGWGGEKLSGKFQKQKFIAFFRTVKGNPLSFMGGLSLLITGFLIVASGLLNLAAREPLYAWQGVWPMLGLALSVAVCTCVTSICKTQGAPDMELKEKKKQANASNSQVKDVLAACPKLKPWISCLAVNVAMSFGACLFAFIVWLIGSDGEKPSLSNLFSSFFSDGRGIAFLGAIVLLGSVAAPVLQLFGIQKHDEYLAKKRLSDYGISGSEWLKICGGCEPFFVVVIGLVLSCAVSCDLWKPLEHCQSSAHPFISYWPIFISVLTVFVIIVLRIMETWAEKNSTLRNYIYTRVRGSSRGIEDRREQELNTVWLLRLCDQYNRIMTRQMQKQGQPWTPVSFSGGANNNSTVAVIKYLQWLRERALNLAALKLYDKQRKIADLRQDDHLQLQPHAKLLDDKATSVADKYPAVQSWKAKHLPCNCFYVDFQGCDVYFTQDDPFSHDVLEAIFDWIKVKRLFDDIRAGIDSELVIDSFSYAFRPYCNSQNPYKGLKEMVCEAKKCGTPFLIRIASSVSDPRKIAEAVVSDWETMAEEIDGLVVKGGVVARANQEVLHQLDEIAKE